MINLSTNEYLLIQSEKTSILFILDMSAAEYREHLKAQNSRKRDPRQNQHMSMKEKRDLINRL